MFAARSSQSNSRASGPEVLKRERGHVTSESGVSEVGVFRALQPYATNYWGDFKGFTRIMALIIKSSMHGVGVETKFRMNSPDVSQFPAQENSPILLNWLAPEPTCTIKLGQMTTWKSVPLYLGTLKTRSYNAYQATPTPLFSNRFMLVWCAMNVKFAQDFIGNGQ